MDAETLAVINAVCAALNTGAVIVLVGVTVWYARSTARMLRHMSDQTEAVHRQSRVLVTTAKISATVPLVSLAIHEGKAKRRLETLEAELAAIEQEPPEA